MCTDCEQNTLADMGIDLSARYRVRGWEGIAFYVRGAEMVDDADTEWTGIQVATGNVEVVMVGDDRVHVVDPADLTALDDSEYCADCGQIGCRWNTEEDN